MTAADDDRTPTPAHHVAVGSGAGVDYAALFTAIPTAYLVMSPELFILAVNDAYCSTVGRAREELVGRYVFDAFPPTADALDGSGVSRVQLSFEKARDTGQPDTMPIQKYDIPDPATGGMVERFWSLISVPVLDQDGKTVLVVQRTEDITEYVQGRLHAEAGRRESEQWRRRVADADADLFARAKELEAARKAEVEATRRFAALADVALLLAGAGTVEDIVGIVVDRGMQALDAGGGSLAVRRDDSDILDVAITASLGEQTRQTYATMPLHGPMPTSSAAATGNRILLRDRAAAVAWDAEMDSVVELTGCVAWAALPLSGTRNVLGALTIGWPSPQQFTPDELEVLDAMAAQCANALERVGARQAERAATADAVRMSETLQRSLLSEPPQPDDLRIAVRYRPAAEQAQVGGDWYDGFVTSKGVTSLVVGDVTGHDQNAAAAMGQVRSLLRGIGYAIGQPPAAVLATLDQALQDLDVGTLATAVLAQVHQTQDERRDGVRRLVWSNAGHLPPLVIAPDGTAELLRTTADLLLGLDPRTERADHEVTLQPGATVLLYTDGLVERRGQSIEEGLAWLTSRAAALAHLGPDDLCDALLAGVEANEDDIAVLAARAAPQQRACPPG